MTLLVAPIVEGETEVGCIERLLQRVWVEVLAQAERLQVVRPVRVKRDQVIRQKGTELADGVTQAARVLAAARARAGSDARSLILLVIDAEGDCPAALAPGLLAAARAARPGHDIDCVLPKRMFENWFVAAAESLRTESDLPAGPPRPDDLEGCSGVNWLVEQFKANGRTYKKPVDGLRFTRVFDLAACRAASPSFDKLCRVLGGRVSPATPAAEDPDATAPGC